MEREIVEAKREEETTNNNNSRQLRQGERYRLTVQHEWPEQRQQRLQTRQNSERLRRQQENKERCQQRQDTPADGTMIREA